MAYEREAQTDLAELNRLAASLTETDPPSGYERDAQTDVVELGRLTRDVTETDPALGGYERVGQTNLAVLRRKLIGGVVVPPVATSYSLSGPSTGTVGVASTNFTVALTPLGGTVVGTVTITPSDGGGGGTFTPTTVGLTTTSPSATFTYTPASSGAKTISTTNSGGLTNPSSLVYTATAVGLADGDPVSSWTDSSTGGHTATASGTARPTFKTNILNGKPVVRYAQASNQILSLANTVGMSPNHPWSSFVVMKYLLTNTNLLALINVDFGSFSFQYRNAGGGQVLTADNAGSGYNTTTAYAGAFHIFSTETVSGTTPVIWVDGTSVATTNGVGGSLNPFCYLGFGDGDIAEVIHYSSTVQLRAKLVVLLTVLLTPSQMPPEDELEAMIGDRHKIRQYLLQHDAHPTKAQLDAAVEPFAVGDRQNIEKYLGTKYGITVAGGTAVQPDTVAGLVGWWKADSLL